jgi:hypothetical protein
LDWAKDPIVMAEKDVQPIHAACLVLLASAKPGRTSSVDGDSFLAFHRAERLFRTEAAAYLSGFDLRFERADHERCKSAADGIAEAQVLLRQLSLTPEDSGLRARCYDHLSQRMTPAIEAGLDVFRRLFLGMVLARHDSQAKHAQEVVRKLDEISKQIYFVSINASIQAVRAGDEGLGFAQVSKEIRNLAQSTQATTQKLSKLM